jgi:hypothetical protein
MKPKEMREAIHLKNGILDKQEKRIALLEEKISELRKKYFHLKYAGMVTLLKASI